jgi:hypothetical protein
VRIYNAGHWPVNYVCAYGEPAGRILIEDGRYQAYDMGWSPVGVWSTERRALHALDQHSLRSIYGTTSEALLTELRRGLIALDQEPANELRLARLNSEDIRWLSAELLAAGWRKGDLTKLVCRWRDLRGEAS